MKYYILASLIIFCLVTVRAVKKNMRAEQKEQENFWAREAQANLVRKKNIDHLDYISIPNGVISILSSRSEDPFPEYVRIINNLRESKILNLSGITNTDLKFQYGVGNLTVLSQYDENFTLLIRTIQQAAEKLLEAEETANAKELLEYGVSIGSDITATYTTLATIYLREGHTEKVDRLLMDAKLLDSANKNIIVRKLEEVSQSIC